MGGARTAGPGTDHVEQERDDRHPQQKGPQAGKHVPEGELRVIGGHPAWHPHQAEGMHGQEVEIGAYEGEQEVQLAQPLVGHAAGELGEPVIDGSEDAHHGGAIDHIVEVAHHKISVIDVNIDRHGGQHDAGDAGKNEVDQAAQAEQHRCGELQLAAPDRAQPGEHLHTGGHGDQHRGEHEQIAHPLWYSAREEVVNPHDQAQANNDERGQRNVDVAKQGLA